MSEHNLRVLKIKTAVVKRLMKEKITYEREASQQVDYIKKLKEQGEDKHIIKKQEEVLQESLMMIPDCQRRLKKAAEELKKNITDNQWMESDIHTEAQNVLVESESS